MKSAVRGLLLCAMLARATPNACPTATTTQSVSNGASSASVTVPAAGPGNDTTTINSAGGCASVNLILNNFTLVTNSTIGFNGVLTLGGTYLATSPADTALFSSVRGSGASSIDGNNDDGNNNFVSKSSSAGHSVNWDFAYTVSASPYFVSRIVLTVNQPVVETGTSGSLQLFVCQGGTQTGVFTAGSCAGGGTLVSSPVFTLSTGTSNQFMFGLSANQTYVDVTTVITLTGAGSKFAGFDTFSEEFVAPEPATFVLLGTALASIGCLRHRRKRT